MEHSKQIQDLTFEFATREEFLPVFRALRPKLFGELGEVDPMSYWSEEEFEKNKNLQSKCHTEVRFYLLCKDKDEVIGWSYGVQKDAEEFYMVNSAVFPEYRKSGIYNYMLKLVTDKAKEEGFQVISSLHQASNNPVLIPKLKYGFKIVGMRIHPRFGILIELHYYTNEKVEKIYEYRTGQAKSLP